MSVVFLTYNLQAFTAMPQFITRTRRADAVVVIIVYIFLCLIMLNSQASSQTVPGGLDRTRAALYLSSQGVWGSAVAFLCISSSKIASDGEFFTARGSDGSIVFSIIAKFFLCQHDNS